MAAPISLAQGLSNLANVQVYGSDQNQTGTGQVNENTSQNQLNQYTAGQQALQGQLAGAAGNLLQGNIPQNFGLTPEQRQVAMMDWQRDVAPILTAQYGVGSPVLNSSLEQLMLRLAAQQQGQAMPNYLNAFNAAQNFAFGAPIGVTNATTQLQNSNTTQGTNIKGYDTKVDAGGMLGALGDIFMGIF